MINTVAEIDFGVIICIEVGNAGTALELTCIGGSKACFGCACMLEAAEKVIGINDINFAKAIVVGIGNGNGIGIVADGGAGDGYFYRACGSVEDVELVCIEAVGYYFGGAVIIHIAHKGGAAGAYVESALPFKGKAKGAHGGLNIAMVNGIAEEKAVAVALLCTIAVVAVGEAIVVVIKAVVAEFLRKKGSRK